ncbi:uncharacterized protein ACRADG_005244 isoform 1-T1 [Cochliomyia hominivorax]
MKLIILILTQICVLIQLLTLSRAYPYEGNTSPKEKFLEFYEKELYIMSKDFCEKAKNISENLLSANEIREASTPELKELKSSLQQFLKDYPHFQRYRLQQPLLMLFMKLADTRGFENLREDQDKTVQKFKQLLHKYFAQLIKDYEQNYGKFIKEKFLPKIEEVKMQLEPEDLEDVQYLNDLDKFIVTLKSCQSYQCFPFDLDAALVKLEVSMETLIKYTKKDYKKFTTLRAIQINTMGQNILKNENLTKLTSSTKNNLTLDINDFKEKFTNNNDIDTFVTLIQEKPSFPQKYYNNTDIPLEDRQILTELFNAHLHLADNFFEIEIIFVMLHLNLKRKIISESVAKKELADLKPLKKFSKIWL